MELLAIDPGNTESAYCLIDAKTYKPIEFGKVENNKLLEIINRILFFAEEKPCVVFEMIAHYGCGMPAGKSVFDTCVWIGRFMQEAENMVFTSTHIVYRKDEKMNLCGTMKAKDGNIIQALIDRFAPDIPNRGKGTKKEPGWFYGFKADVWQAYAVGITFLDLVGGKKNEADKTES